MKTIVFKYGQMRRFLSSPTCRWGETTVRAALRGVIYITDLEEIRKAAEAFIAEEARSENIKRRAVCQPQQQVMQPTSNC